MEPPIVTEELLSIYSNVFAQQNIIAEILTRLDYASLEPIAASLCRPFSREEIEYDVETILTSEFIGSLKRLEKDAADEAEKSVSGGSSNSDPFYREVIRRTSEYLKQVLTQCRTKAPFSTSVLPLTPPASPLSAEQLYHHQFQSLTLPEALPSAITEPTNFDEDLPIDLSFKPNDVKLEKPDEGEVMEAMVPEVVMPEEDLPELLKVRLERLRNIQMTKPKYNIDEEVKEALKEMEFKFHEKMARQYPKRELSDHQRLRREKNTKAARYTRMKYKAFEKVMQVRFALLKM